MSANLFVRAVDSAVLSTIGSYASIRGNDFPDASSLIVFASSTAFVVPLRKASMHVGAAVSLPCAAAFSHPCAVAFSFLR